MYCGLLPAQDENADHWLEQAVAASLQYVTQLAVSGGPCVQLTCTMKVQLSLQFSPLLLLLLSSSSSPFLSSSEPQAIAAKKAARVAVATKMAGLFRFMAAMINSTAQQSNLQTAI